MRNPTKLFSPNGQLRIDNTTLVTGDWHTITVSEDAKFSKLYNGNINILDLVVSINIIMGNTSPTEQELLAADMNGDGGVNIQDIVLLVNLILQT